MSQFGRYNSTSYTGQYSSNNSYTNNYNNFRSNSNNNYYSNNHKIGSYRCRDYDFQKLPTTMSSLDQWKQHIPMSIAFRQQTIHLTPIQLRSQDYHLIRTKKIEERHCKNLQMWINKNLFNTNLLSNDAMSGIKQVSSFKQSPPPFQTIVNMFKGGNNRYPASNNNMFNSTNNNNNNNNTNKTINNPFTSNTTNNTNMFTNSNTYNTRSQSSDLFSSNTNNPFTNINNNNTNSNNNFVYGNRTNTNNNTSNSNINNPFSNTSNKNTSGNNSTNNNLFTNNNSSNSYNSNNNNNPLNKNNLFTNNNTNNNPFSSNNNTNNNNNNLFNNTNKGNNLFSNNSNNNLFTNNNNNNNPFSSNNNNNNNSTNSPNTGYGIISQYTILQMMNMMQTCIDKALNNNSNSMSNSNTLLSNNNQLFGMNSTGYNTPNTYYLPQNINKKYDQWFHQPFDPSSTPSYSIDQYIQSKAKNKKKNPNRTYVVIKQDSNSRIFANSDTKNPTGIILNNYQKNSLHNDHKKNWNLWEGDNNTRLYNNTNYLLRVNQNSNKTQNDSIPQYNKYNKDPIQQFQQNINQHQTSRFKSTNHHESTFLSNSNPSHQPQQDTLYSNHNKSPKITSSHTLNQIKYKYCVQCIWAENLRGSYHDPQTQNTDDYIIQGDLLLKYNPPLSQLHDIILSQILDKYSPQQSIQPQTSTQPQLPPSNQPIIRKDATLTLQMPTSPTRNQYLVKGTIFQHKINLPKGYDYIYDEIDGWQVKNLTIVNKYGRIQWPGIINIKGTNFSNQIQILQNQGDVKGILDTYDMIVTFNSLPPSIIIDINDQLRVKKQMDKYIKKISQVIQDHIVLVNLDLKNKSYTFKVQKIKNCQHSSVQNGNQND